MTDRKNIATAKAEFHLWMAHRRKHRGNATEWAWATRASIGVAKCLTKPSQPALP
jgi:hypothetical protein